MVFKKTQKLIAQSSSLSGTVMLFYFLENSAQNTEMSGSISKLSLISNRNYFQVCIKDEHPAKYRQIVRTIGRGEMMCCDCQQ